jgi:hypothetical protein
VIGPLGALIDPVFDRVDLGCGDLALLRHLLAVLRTNQPQVETARRRAAASQNDFGAAEKRGLPPIEPQPIALTIGTVALVAVLLEDRLDVADEIDARRGRCDRLLRREGHGAENRHSRRREQQTHVSSRLQLVFVVIRVVLG